MFNNLCEICNKKRGGCCIVCSSSSSSKCVDCNPSYTKIDNKVVCKKCVTKATCEDVNCNKLKLRKCVKCQYTSNHSTCLEHSHQFGTCNKCFCSSFCDTCKAFSLTTWTHECGTFCSDCNPLIRIDVSPLTLLKMLPVEDPRRKNPVYAICQSLIKCKGCMEGKTVTEWQLGSMRRQYSEDWVHDPFA